jgi:hypothetical protein
MWVVFFDSGVDRSTRVTSVNLATFNYKPPKFSLLKPHVQPFSSFLTELHYPPETLCVPPPHTDHISNLEPLPPLQSFLLHALLPDRHEHSPCTTNFPLTLPLKPSTPQCPSIDSHQPKRWNQRGVLKCWPTNTKCWVITQKLEFVIMAMAKA